MCNQLTEKKKKRRQAQLVMAGTHDREKGGHSSQENWHVRWCHFEGAGLGCGATPRWERRPVEVASKLINFLDSFLLFKTVSLPPVINPDGAKLKFLGVCGSRRCSTSRILKTRWSSRSRHAKPVALRAVPISWPSSKWCGWYRA